MGIQLKIVKVQLHKIAYTVAYKSQQAINMTESVNF